jgi:hypothetical protein
MRHFRVNRPQASHLVLLCLALAVLAPLACLPPAHKPAGTGGSAAISATGEPTATTEETTPEGPSDAEVAHQKFIEAGGTDASEAAVQAGLEWLIRHQSNDGHWSMDHFEHDAQCNCTGGGQKNDIAGTAFGILPFLARGETHRGGETGKYVKSLDLALKYLISHQKPDGDLRDGSTEIQKMYTHGLATITLCEAYDLTVDPMLREAAQKAVDFTLKAQHKDGGWRYKPGQPGDMSVSSWQLMSLKAAQMSGMSVPKDTLERALGFVDSVEGPNEDGYCYLPGPTRAPSPAMTAAGMLCRQYLRVGGESFSSPHMLKGSDRLLKAIPAKGGHNFYYYYYATQVLFNIGGEPWEKWNSKTRDYLISIQDQGLPGHEHQKGSWEPTKDSHNPVGGRMMTTCLAMLSLEVYYRQFPLNRLELGDAQKELTARKKPKK